MDPILVGIIGILFLFVLLACGLDVGTSLGIIGFLGFWILVGKNAAFSRMAITPFETIADYSLAVLPLFLLMANIIFNAGFGNDAYRVASRWIGHLPGGLAMATVAGCAGFAAMSASSLGTAITMGLIAFPEMEKYHYKKSLSAGALASGGTIGILIPPSGMLILYGVLTETSIGKLFIGGIIPGILEAVFYIITIYIICLINPSLGPRGPKYSLKEKFTALMDCGEIVGLVILVLGGLIIGWFTPTEAGAVGAAGALLFSVIRKRLNWKCFKNAIHETIKTTGMLYAVMIGAYIFQYLISVSNIPVALSSFVKGLTLPPLGVMGIILLIYIVLGCFMDAMTMIILTIPIFLPVAIASGFGPIWFGIIVVRVMEMALITPPLGMIVYTISSMFNVPVPKVFKGVVPFIIADICHILLLLLVPGVVLWLPGIM
ncbi:MAG: TRAP transporter large permease [Deltaproteobacteria bacterium]|nr:TRAP transporter large permease [Deltaproteobacteria bacterium]